MKKLFLFMLVLFIAGLAFADTVVVGTELKFRDSLCSIMDTNAVLHYIPIRNLAPKQQDIRNRLVHKYSYICFRTHQDLPENYSEYDSDK